MQPQNLRFEIVAGYARSDKSYKLLRIIQAAAPIPLHERLQEPNRSPPGEDPEAMGQEQLTDWAREVIVKRSAAGILEVYESEASANSEDVIQAEVAVNETFPSVMLRARVAPLLYGCGSDIGLFDLFEQRPKRFERPGRRRRQIRGNGCIGVQPRQQRAQVREASL